MARARERTSADPSRQAPQQPSHRLRIPLLLASFTLVAAWALLQGQAKVLESMAPPGCVASGPAALQGGLGAASRDEAVEIVTGWHAFTRASHGDVIERMSTECVSTRAPAGMDNLLRTRNADTTARVWLITDMVLFAPAYAVLLLLVLAWASQLPPPTADPGRVQPEVPLLRAAMWLARRTRVMTALVLVGLLADWGENALLLRRLSAWWRLLDRTGVLQTGDLHLGLVHTIGIVKWLALAPALLVTLLFVVRQAVRAAVLLGRALPRLWVQLVLVIVFAVLVVVPDQGADALRRLSAWQWLSTVSLMAVFVVVVVCSGGEVLKPLTPTDVPTPPDNPSLRTGPPRSGDAIARAAVAARWGAAVTALGLGLFVVSRITGWRGLVIPAALVGLVGAVSMALDIVDDLGERMPGVTRPDVAAATVAGRTVAATPTATARDAAVVRVAPCLGGVIVGALGFATLRASAGDFALIGSGPGGSLLLRQLVGLALTVSTGLVVLGARRLLIWAATWTDRQRVIALIAFVLIHVPAVGLHDPDINLRVSAAIGTLGLVAVFLSGFGLIGSITARVSDVLMRRPRIAQIALPSALRMLRLRATPIMGLLAAWVLLVPTVDNPSYHAVRQQPGAPPAALTIDELATRWMTDQSADAPNGTEPSTEPNTSPALLVASSGGGIRAAYWTAAVLDCLTERSGTAADPCSADAAPDTIARRRRALLAMSGVSGGSLGLDEYVVAIGAQWDTGSTITPLPRTWYRHRLGGDFLAPTIAGWLFNDGANALLRPDHGVDRAAILERAWERTWPDHDLNAGFLGGQRGGHQPALLLNGFSVDDGCRVLTSPLQTQPPRSASDCSKLVTSGTPPAALSSVDLAAQLCTNRDISYATAALASARFPFVSPAGRLGSCGEGSAVEIVDGGYRETSGASTLVELWPELRAALDAAAPPADCVAPVFVQIDNGYASDQLSGVGRGTVGQVLAPLRAVMSSSAGEEAAARAASRELFDAGPGHWFRITTYAHPGSTAPLGWVLSSDAMKDLEHQLVINGDTIMAIRSLLDAPGACR